MDPRGRGGSAFASRLHPRDRAGKFALKPGHFVPRDRSGKARRDLSAPKTPPAKAAPGAGAAKPSAAGGARERLGTLLDRLRLFRDHAREHGVSAAVASRALVAVAALDNLFGGERGEGFHPLATEPQALLDNWGYVKESLKAISELAAEVGPEAVHALLKLFAAHARGDLPDDERRLVEAWLREQAWIDAPGEAARELAEAARRECDLIAR